MVSASKASGDCGLTNRWIIERIVNNLARHPRYGWLVGLVVFLSFTLTLGIAQYSFGVFVTELERDLGWTRTQVSTALSFFAMMGLSALPVGWLLDRFGARPVIGCLVLL